MSRRVDLQDQLLPPQLPGTLDSLSLIVYGPSRQLLAWLTQHPQFHAVHDCRLLDDDVDTRLRLCYQEPPCLHGCLDKLVRRTYLLRELQSPDGLHVLLRGTRELKHQNISDLRVDDGAAALHALAIHVPKSLIEDRVFHVRVASVHENEGDVAHLCADCDVRHRVKAQVLRKNTFLVLHAYSTDVQDVLLEGDEAANLKQVNVDVPRFGTLALSDEQLE